MTEAKPRIFILKVVRYEWWKNWAEKVLREAGFEVVEDMYNTDLIVVTSTLPRDKEKIPSLLRARTLLYSTNHPTPGVLSGFRREAEEEGFFAVEVLPTLRADLSSQPDTLVRDVTEILANPDFPWQTRQTMKGK